MAITQVSNSLVKQDLTISGGTVDNTVIGSGTPAAGTFTTVAGTLASTVTGTTAAASDNSTKIATTAYVTTAIANLVDSAPGTLNTLNELAAALGDDASFATTVTNSIATKLPLAGGTLTGNLTLSKSGTNSAGIIFATSSANRYIESTHDGIVSIGTGGTLGGGTKYITIDSGNVGIGVTDPGDYDSRAERLVVGESGDAGITIACGSSSDARLVFAVTDQTDLSNGSITYDQSNDSMAFETAGTGRMRIDSSGDVIVGGASSGANDAVSISNTGYIQAIVNGDTVGYFNRRTSDGEIIRLQKDGSTVGTIGTESTDIFIGTGDTGIRFNDAVDGVLPYNTGSGQTDATINLGFSSVRWKDLHISGTANVGTQVKWPSVSYDDMAMGLDSNGFYLYNVDDSAYRIILDDGNGRIGIGNTSPSAHVTITDENAGQAVIHARNFATSATGSFVNQHSYEFRAASSTTTHGMLVALNENDASRRAFEVAGGGGIFLTATSIGTVGIGTQSPASQFHIKNDSTHAIQHIQAAANSSASLRLLNDAVTWQVDCRTDDDFGIYNQTANATRLFITTDGRTKFGDGNVTGTTVDTSGTISNLNNAWSWSVINTTTSSQPHGILCRYTNSAPSNTSSHFFLGMAQNNSRFQLRSNGGLANFSANDVNLSDEREKKNIEDSDSQWSVLKNIKIRKFHYNDDDDSDKKRFGVIAQEVESHAPDVVTDDWEKQPAMPETLWEEGEDLPEGVSVGDVKTAALEQILRKAVKEQQVTWMAIKALQEAMARIETLEAEVAALKGE